MSDLISKSELIERIKEQYPFDSNNHVINDVVSDIVFNIIKEQKTAYDVDKVISKLKSHNNSEKMATSKLFNGQHRYYRAISVTKAIKIVKGGGIDE